MADNDEGLTLMDVQCLKCGKELHTEVIDNELYIRAVYHYCGWVAPPDQIEFLDRSDKTGYDDIYLVWPRKTEQP